MRYPGKAVNHRVQLGALLGFSAYFHLREGRIRTDLLETDESGVPPRAEWDKLHAEIEADENNRIFISHEYLSQIDDVGANTLVDELDPDRVHVVITLRSPGAIAPSLWAQGIKDDGQTLTLNDWLNRVYGDDPQDMPAHFRRAYDQGQLIERWAGIVGADNVTVVIVDEKRPNFLTDTFEALLGLPPGLLGKNDGSAALSNRSMTAVEAELFRRVNVVLRDEEIDWFTYHKLGRLGAMGRVVNHRVPPADEPPVRLPQWAADLAQRDGEKFAEHIERTGVRVVGDLAKLKAPPKVGADRVPADQVPFDIGVQSVVGALAAGQRQKNVADKKLASLKKTTAPKRSRPTKKAAGKRARPSETYTTRELTRAVAARLKHKLKTGRSKPIK
ncbi:hypothetical protein GCM10027344_17510 [Spelaeicoccus albus]